MSVAVVKRSPLLKLIRTDPHYLKLVRMRESGIYAVDTAALIKEIEGLHSVRASRTMKARTLITDKETTLNMVLENQAYRSRAVQIKITCFKTKTKLDEQLDLISKYLMTTYSMQLGMEFKTQKSKNDAIATALSEFYKLRNKLGTVLSISDMFIADLDQNHWTISNLTKILSLENVREI